MIDIQDLRIGNLIHPNTGGTVDNEVYWVQVIEMESGKYVVCGLPQLSSGPYRLAGLEKNWKPIPLTPEWLELLGFESMDEGAWFKWETVNEGGNVRLTLLTNDTYYNKGRYWFVGVSTYEGDADFLEERIKYVHRLQNLFWVLTGQELKTTE